MDIELKQEVVPTSENNLPASSFSIEVDVDEALEKSGFGRFQYSTQILLTYISIAITYQSVLSYFIANDPSWKCIHNSTSKFCEQNFGVKIAADNEKFASRCTLQRDEWTYTTGKKYSIVTEFDLVCKKTAVAALASSIFHIGGGIGMFISGLAADYFGRKPVLIASLCILTATSIACSYVTNTLQLIILRAFLGAGEKAACAISYAYLSECSPPNYRTLVTICYGFGVIISQFVIDAVAYYIRYWRNIQFYASFPCILGIAFLFTLPESPRWLMVNCKQLEAEITLKKIARFNGNPLPIIHLKSPAISHEKRYTYFHLFQSRKPAVVTILLALIWATVGLSYFTIAFESSNLGGDMYQAFAFSVSAEIPSMFVTYFICNRFGRKKATLISLVLTGVFAAATTLIPNMLSFKFVLNMTLMMFAKFFVDIALMSLSLWTFELFPTVLRLQGTAISILSERIGSFIAPFLTSVLHQVNSTLPYIILLVTTVLAGGGGVILPETNQLPTRERYEDFVVTPFPGNIVDPNNDERNSGDIQQEKH